ncbi:hypothetical protein CEXT_688371 [Caerostris extrusa]|uniref:Uncharacterized protein n=1 Tax=Caerostris extrusa TaxID=172846 RepID=A0AAV4W5Z8_CAEEX|nr:hypothetical protein CEXT_688371 [Caerostris extrusa]
MEDLLYYSDRQINVVSTSYQQFRELWIRCLKCIRKRSDNENKFGQALSAPNSTAPLYVGANPNFPLVTILTKNKWNHLPCKQDFRSRDMIVGEGKKILTSELEVVLATRCLGLERGAVKSQTSIEEDFRLSCAGAGLLVFISLNN